MEERIEKYTIEVDDTGHVTISGGEGRLRFTALEALMVLDILKNEENKLKRLAEEAAPYTLNIGNYSACFMFLLLFVSENRATCR